MDLKLFHSMFGPLSERPMSDEELNLIQKFHPSTFGGMPNNAIHQAVTNPRLAQDPNNLGYEDSFGHVARVFSPENPAAFMQYFQQNARNMSPYGLKKLFDYSRWLQEGDSLNRGKR